MPTRSARSEHFSSRALIGLIACLALIPDAATGDEVPVKVAAGSAGTVLQAGPQRRVYLLRHGEAAYVAPDGTPVVDTDAVGLTARGREQSRAVGLWFREAGVGIFDRVFSSPLPRARQSTAELLAAMRMEVEPETWPELREMASPGPEADALMRMQARRVLDVLATDRSWRSVLLVTHRGVGRALLNVILEDPGPALSRIELDTGCLLVLDHEPIPGLWRVRSVNLCPDPARYVLAPPRVGVARH